jgi:polysaccharide biosynthesis protein PslG
MTPHGFTWRNTWPWLLIVGVLLLGPLLQACAAPEVTATPTPTKTPRSVAAAATPVPEITEPPLLPSATQTAPVAQAAATAKPAAAATATAAPAAPKATAPAKQTAPTPAPAANAATIPSPDFGAQAFLWWRSEVADRDLSLLKDAGFHWVKQLFSWQDIEGAGQGKYDWSRTDRIVDQADKAGLKLLVRISADPDRAFWAGQPPDSSAAFTEFAGEVAKRYAGRIDGYQIWNEPNLAREWGNKRPDPAAYARMLKAAYAAIKANDPNAIVVSAGMAPTTEDDNIAMPDLKFYQGMYDAMGPSGSKGYFDMLGAHAAGYAVAPETDPKVVVADPKLHNNDPSAPELLRVYAFRHLEDVRALMERNGDAGKRIAVLEFGWTSDDRQGSDYFWHGAGAGIDEMVKGDYLYRAYKYAAEHWQPWIGPMFAIYMPDPAWTKKDEQYYWSIIGPGYPDLYLRPSYVALCVYLNGVEGQHCKYDPNQK